MVGIENEQRYYQDMWDIESPNFVVSKGEQVHRYPIHRKPTKSDPSRPWSSFEHLTQSADGVNRKEGGPGHPVDLVCGSI